MANNDPTGILPSIVGVAMTSLKEFVLEAWNMDKNAAAADEALVEMTLALEGIPVFQNSFEVQKFVNKGKEKVEQLRSAVDDARGASSSTSWNPFPRFDHSRRISKACNELERFQSTAVLPVLKVVQDTHNLLQGQENASCVASVSLFSCAPVSPTQPVVGISDLVSKLQSTLLDGNSSQWINVTGAGGMGKSFLVRIVCNTQEVRACFGDNILWLSFSHECTERDQLLTQRDLFVRLSRQQQVGHIMTLSSGNNALQDLIMRQQQRKPYLLVLDNVWSRPTVENFDFLRGSESSKVIVTSRYQDIVSHTDRTVIRMGGLSMEDAYRLFCKHAFSGIDSAPAEMEDHVRKVIGHCGGNPLMLEVLGKFMRSKSLPGQWEFVLNEIEKKKRSHEVHEHVFEILRLSYDALHDMDKNRFLFLASPDLEQNDPYQTFYCWRGLHFLSYDDNLEMAKEEYSNAITTLDSASLVEAFELGTGYYIQLIIRVPELLKELAEYIIRKDNLSHSTSYKRPCYMSWPGSPPSPLSVGTMTIPDKYGDISADYFSRFPNLQALKVSHHFHRLRVFEGAHIPSGLIQLRYLSLVEGILDASMTTALCESLKQLSRLEYLSIQGEAAEEIIFDLGFLECMPNLTQLCVRFYPTAGIGARLINSHHIQNLTKLVTIDLSTFEDWDWQRLKHLKTIAIRGTSAKDITRPTDRFLSSLSTCTSLQQLVISGVAFHTIPAGIHWPHLTTLHLEVAMQCLPNTWLQSLPRLEELRLNGGGMLVELPPFDKLPRLRSLMLSKLAGDHISFTPEEHSSLPHLSRLAIEDCVNLVEPPAIQQFPEATLAYLEIIDCKKLIRLPSSMLEKISCLRLSGLTSLEWSREASLYSLEALTLEAGMGLPLGIEAPNLLWLFVRDGKMKHLPLIPFPKLEGLLIERCAEMETILPDDTQFSVCFPNLKELTLRDLPKLVGVLPSTLFSFPKLERLCIERCVEVETILPDDTQFSVCFPNLKALALIDLPKLVGVLPSTLFSFPKLEQLYIKGCLEVETILPDDTQFPVCFPNLWDLTLIELPKLVRVFPATLFPFPKLWRLTIERCAELEKILADDTQFPVCFPNLMYLFLIELPKLVGVLPSTLFSFPKLKGLVIEQCAEMETILPDDTQFPVCFPNLTELTLKDLPKLVRVPPTRPECWLRNDGELIAI